MTRSRGLGKRGGVRVFQREGERLAAAYERGFAGATAGTIGIEEELFLVGPQSFDPAEEIESVLHAVGDDGRFHPELRAAQVEITTSVSRSVAGACREVADARRHLVEKLAGRLRVLAAGTHPTATDAIAITPRPRYREIAREYSWAADRGSTSGLHVHVGVDDAAEALEIYNAARSFLPEIAALAANSPYVEGRDSGLAAARLKLLEHLPRSGTPPVLGSWLDLVDFVGRGGFGGLSDIWWDLRPRPDLGTLEFRVADTQTTIGAAGAVAAVCQSLVAWLRARAREGESLPVLPSHFVDENRWRALRNGLAGELVDFRSGRPEPTRGRIARLLLELEPAAIELGCAEELADAWSLLEQNGAERQRATAKSLGLHALPGWLAGETERSAAASDPAAAALVFWP
jgi:carboxylate-amine ligase